MSDVRYAIKRGGKWLQGVEPNQNYCNSAKAPTMGDRHTYSEYKTVWGTEQVAFERLTATNYIKTIMKEYRWGDKPATDFKVVAISN